MIYLDHFICLVVLVLWISLMFVVGITVIAAKVEKELEKHHEAMESNWQEIAMMGSFKEEMEQAENGKSTYPEMLRLEGSGAKS